MFAISVVTCCKAWTGKCNGGFNVENVSKVRVELLSQLPLLARFRHVLDAEECAYLRRIVLDSIVFFNDTSISGEMRHGGRMLEFQREVTPTYHMPNEMQVSLSFPRPPAVMCRLYERLAQQVGAHTDNIEAIYHLYAPGAMPTNLHLDNFNAALFPHRVASFSVFLEDLEDGGTVFPLLLAGTGGPEARAPASPVALEDEEVARWAARLGNATSPGSLGLRAGGYADRRVEADEAEPFLARALAAARVLCSGGRRLQEPAVPERGTAYMWWNTRPDGTEDPRSAHAACGARRDLKVLVTVFVRDAPGPFGHGGFWDPLVERPEVGGAETQRRLEMQQFQDFRLFHLERLYHAQGRAVLELAGIEAAGRLVEEQKLHQRALAADEVHHELLRRQDDLRHEHGYASRAGWSGILADHR